jgi:hypothetical protein
MSAKHLLQEVGDKEGMIGKVKVKDKVKKGVIGMK